MERPTAAAAGGAARFDTVRVDLAGRAYDITVGRGLLAEVGHRLARLRPGAMAAIVTDETVAGLHLAALQTSLAAAGIGFSTVIVPPGEGTKSLAELANVADQIIAARIERRDLVLALGGGVIGDLAGLAAALVRRGVDLVQIPTTLLAQVDSSVGGKTAVNSRHGKNLVGAFHQPIAVFADTALLDTLSEREFRAGYAEVLKYGLIGDEAFYGWLEAGAWREIFAGGPARERAVALSCAAKAAIVERDETETGDRALLNLGHTFGHAIEAVTGYDGRRVVHGEAVAIGMRLAFDFSRRLGLCPGQDSTRVRSHLEAVGLPTRLADIGGFSAGPDDLLDAIRQDKKVSRGTLTFILAHGIGRSFIARDVAASQVLDFLRDDLAEDDDASRIGSPAS